MSTEETTQSELSPTELVLASMIGLNGKHLKIADDLIRDLRAELEQTRPAVSLLRSVARYMEATQFLIRTDIYYEIVEYLEGIK